jgi:glycosyltransferase involved in cell wall biosynthesis
MPKVSVIIPNYNHANFLEARIQSVLAQTYQDFEIILLDDASTDRSPEILQAHAEHPRVHQVICNTVNTKTPFKQWNKGLREARGEYIWIAESDDFADPRLLETLVPPLDAHANIGVSYCQSWQVDASDRVLGTLQNWTDRLDPERWKNSYINSGPDEYHRYMSLLCTIPNASAVVFRRSVYDKIGGADTSFRLTGDWLMWSKMLLASDVAFTAEPLNYFRSHATTVRGQGEKSNLSLMESFRVMATLAQETALSELTRDRALNGLMNDWLLGAWIDRWNWQTHLEVYRAFKRLDPRLHQRMMGRSFKVLGQRLRLGKGMTLKI